MNWASGRTVAVDSARFGKRRAYCTQQPDRSDDAKIFDCRHLGNVCVQKSPGDSNSCIRCDISLVVYSVNWKWVSFSFCYFSVVGCVPNLSTSRLATASMTTLLFRNFIFILYRLYIIELQLSSTFRPFERRSSHLLFVRLASRINRNKYNWL